MFYFTKNDPEYSIRVEVKARDDKFYFMLEVAPLSKVMPFLSHIKNKRKSIISRGSGSVGEMDFYSFATYEFFDIESAIYTLGECGITGIKEAWLRDVDRNAYLARLRVEMP